jgi:hypothetical protein
MSLPASLQPWTRSLYRSQRVPGNSIYLSALSGFVIERRTEAGFSEPRPHSLEEKTGQPRTIGAAEHSVPEAPQAPAAEAQAVWRTSRRLREHSVLIPLIEW